MRNEGYYTEEYKVHLPFSQLRELLFPCWDEILNELDDEFSCSCSGSDPTIPTAPDILVDIDADLNY